MNVNGINQVDVKMLQLLSKKANEEQLKAIEQLFFEERLRRITARAQKDLKEGK